MKLLIVDDNAGVRTTLKMLLRDNFDDIVAVGDPRLLPALLSAGDVDAVLLDMNFDSSRMDGADGIFWLDRIKALPQPPAVVMITAFGELNLAVDAMKMGAEDFVTKPWDNDELRRKLADAIHKNRQQRQRDMAADEAAELERRNAEKRDMTLDELKAAHIKEVVELCGGNLSAAAQRLGVNRQTLYNILKRL